MEKNKITTEICVNYIIEYFTKKQNLESDEYIKTKNWKRISKKGTDKIIREFENRKNGKIVKIISTEFEIIDIKEEEKVNLKEKLRNIILECVKEYKGSDFHCSFLGEDEVRNWPMCKDEDGEEEYLALQNYSIIELTEDYIIVQCAGDWQCPMELKIKCDEFGLYCSDFKNIDENDEFHLSNSEFLQELFGDDAEKILESARNSSKTNEEKTNLKEKLRNIILEYVKEYKDFNFYYSFLGEDNVRNWPKDMEAEYLESADYYAEPQDLENFEYVDLTDEYLLIDCGGDWQEPMEIKIECDENGLYCSEFTRNATMAGEEKKSNSLQFLNQLFGKDEVKEILKLIETEEKHGFLNKNTECILENKEDIEPKTQERNSLPILNKLKELVFKHIDENGIFDFEFLNDVIENSEKHGEFKNAYCFELTENCIKIKFKNNHAVLLFIKCDESGFYVDEIISETSKTHLTSFEFLDKLFDGKAKKLFGDVVNETESTIDLNSDESVIEAFEEREPVELRSFESHLQNNNFRPHPQIEQIIDDVAFPFKDNVFFKYNPTQLGADEFNRCVDVLCRRNNNRQGSPDEAMYLMMELMRMERPHREPLQDLAIRLVREMYNVPDTIDLKAMLEQKNPEEECDCDGGCDEDNISDKRKAELLPEIEKRRILNTIVHGCAVHQWTSAYHIVRNELDRINPTLVERYNKLSALVNYWNWKFYMEPMIEAGQMPVLQGINKVDVEKQEVQASAMNFPVLVHELSKGVMDYVISMGIPKMVAGVDVTEEELRYIYKEADNYAHEQWHYFFGPTLWRALLKTSDVESQGLPEIISKMSLMSYVELADFCIDVVFDSEGVGKEKMDALKDKKVESE